MNRYEIALHAYKYTEDCRAGRHQWYIAGSRACPEGCESCFQHVYFCYWCGDCDYGEKNGPGYNDCKNCNEFIKNGYNNVELAYKRSLSELMEVEAR